MKIRTAVRQAFDEQRPVFDSLRVRVDTLLAHACRERRWHYESRIKELESYALKVETGRVAALDDMEDFFGATIVVRNSDEVAAAVTHIEAMCDVLQRRPPDPGKTAHRSSSFAFDDLRLYVALKADETVPPAPYDGKRFEIQIKTFLFHAWAIATHDLMYKTGDVEWGKERIGFQVRAMLEQAELAIGAAANLAQASALQKEDSSTAELRQMIDWVRELWSDDQLPRDVRRLAENILQALRLLRIDGADWAAWMREARSAGALALDATPYQSAVMIAVARKPEALTGYLARGRGRLVIYEDEALPKDLDPKHARLIWIPYIWNGSTT